MSKWGFKTLSLNPRGSTELIELSAEQEARISKYIEALEVAAVSVVANPPFSNYFVKEGVGSEFGPMVPAGNIEYGICQALHGEESAVAAFRARYGRDFYGKVVLGIVADKTELGGPCNPCGNCRDIMLEDFGEDLEIVCGAPEGGVAVVATMRHYLFSEFPRLTLDDLPIWVSGMVEPAITEGEYLVHDAYSPKDVHPARRYHALIRTPGRIYVGARDIMVDYHPIYALRDAIRPARRAHDPFVQYVLIVCEDFGGSAPDVMYKDRQHLLELNLEGERISGEKNDPPVYLLTYLPDTHQVTGVWQTSVKEWLPYPFTPENFGEDFMTGVFDPYHKKRHQKKRRQ